MRSYGICQVCGEEILVPEDQGSDGFVHTSEDGYDIHAECCEAQGPCSNPFREQCDYCGRTIVGEDMGSLLMGLDAHMMTCFPKGRG